MKQKTARLLSLTLTTLLLAADMPAAGQSGDDDVWRSVQLGELDYKKEKNYAARLFAYYRFIDDGVALVANREFKMYLVGEGICAIDIRYGRDTDDGATLIAARNLVHPEKKGLFPEFFELQPHTFLENARRNPKMFTTTTSGNTTRVYTKDKKLAGTAVRDTLHHQLRMHYNALAPKEKYSINLAIIKASLSNVEADAVYAIDEDTRIDYVPQGQLKHIVFNGDIKIEIKSGLPVKIFDREESLKLNSNNSYHERCELYIDSVAYMTRSEYKADGKLSGAQRKARSGYKAADVDRLKRKLGVPPLSAATLERIEAQRDWDEELELWIETNQKKK